MRTILLIGAGRSSSFLIDYFLEQSRTQDWQLTVADVSIQSARDRTKNRPASKAIELDINDADQRSREIAAADIVVSMLPAHMHLTVAEECIRQKKPLATASYVSKEMQQLHVPAMKAGVALLNECGLDPGIDHMSAMKIMEEVKSDGWEIRSFKSYCGGLVAPESNDNPWGYKFSWNPRNVVLAGQGTARFIEKGKYRYLPYNRLFAETEKIEIDGLGSFDGYANRDSLSYRPLYHLEKIPTMIRGTLRQSGYCSAWNVLVNLGYTDDSFLIDDPSGLTYALLTDALLPAGRSGESLKSRIARVMNIREDSPEMNLVEWTGILEPVPLNMEKATPAQALQKLLEEKWKLKEADMDMIVMQHLFELQRENGKTMKLISNLVVKGNDSIHTAMAKTVGLPLAIASKLILNGQIKSKGILVPVTREIYEPVLHELENFGVRFSDNRINS